MHVNDLVLSLHLINHALCCTEVITNNKHVELARNTLKEKNNNRTTFKQLTICVEVIERILITEYCMTCTYSYCFRYTSIYCKTAKLLILKHIAFNETH